MWTLCWLCLPGWEVDYVPNQMLASAAIVNRTFRKCDPKHRLNNTILVMRTAGGSLGGNPVGNAHEVAQFAKLHLQFAVILLGDEMLKHPCGQQRTCTADEALAFDQSHEAHPQSQPCWHVWRRVQQIFAVAPLVVRNYLHAECESLPNVITVPVGIQSGKLQLPQARRRHPRRYAWTFSSGHSTNMRTAMVTALARDPLLTPAALAYPLMGVRRSVKALDEALENNENQATTGINSSRSWSGAAVHTRRAPRVSDARSPYGFHSLSLLVDVGTGQAFKKPLANYTNVLCDASFALCPIGNHVETWRLMEALDCGAIPIVSSGQQADYYVRLMPSVARHFVVLDMYCITGKRYTVRSSPCFATWPHNTTRLIAELLADPAALNARRFALAAAYEAHQSSTRKSIADALRSIIEAL